MKLALGPADNINEGAYGSILCTRTRKRVSRLLALELPRIQAIHHANQTPITAL